VAYTIVPFGPQHPVLPEPVHLKLVLDDEKVVEALPAIGYVHRGLEKLAEKRDYKQLIYVAERVCGICSHQHSMCYCMGIEDMMGVEIPQRAKYLRTIWAELHRIHSHLLWIGLFADAIGYESLFMHVWRIREICMDIMEQTAGTRVIISVNQMGGTRKDMDSTQLKAVKDAVAKSREMFDKVYKSFSNDAAVGKRTRGVGIVSKEDMYETGGVGPTMRGSNIAQDVRSKGYAAYGEIDFEPISEPDCDVYARLMVRVRETVQAFDLIDRCIDKIPQGETFVKVKGFPKGESFPEIEQPRGELIYYLKGNGTKNLDRFRIRTPTFANIPPLLKMLPGCEMADVPAIVLSIDPCISCTER
jgi:ech hydrogenase subunit E